MCISPTDLQEVAILPFRRENSICWMKSATGLSVGTRFAAPLAMTGLEVGRVLRAALRDNDGGAEAGFVLDGFKGAVGIVEREGLHGGTEVEIVGDCQEVARVLARHVGDATYLTLTPEQTVVIDNGDAQAVKPTGTAEEVPVECGVLGKQDDR